MPSEFERESDPEGDDMDATEDTPQVKQEESQQPPPPPPPEQPESSTGEGADKNLENDPIESADAMETDDPVALERHQDTPGEPEVFVAATV